MKNRIEFLVEYLNKCCDEYYNQNNPSLSDAEYDALFDELQELEAKTGYILNNSPTMRAGYEVMSELKKVAHNIPLLSLAKTKSAGDIYAMSQESDGYLGLKIDGLTVKMVYKDGVLVEASTRGDGEIGEDITHNAKVFKSVPKILKEKLDITISGEAFIDISTFDSINESIDNDEDKYSTPRNLASGSVRQLDSEICAKRGVSFFPFSVLEGFDDIDSKHKRLEKLAELGFMRLPTEKIDNKTSVEQIEQKILELKEVANKNGYPIDGIVFTFDSVEFSKAQGRTSHHFKDGIAYKFGDPHFKTTLKNIDWNISRTGQLTPIAEFSAVEIDNTNVEKASLHNMTFIEDLKLQVGDEILVSKRNMIIPHVEKNLSAENRCDYSLEFPSVCPVCNQPTSVSETDSSGRIIKVLYCKNSSCAGRQIKKFTHFVSKQAMNIDGLSEATLKKFISLKFVKKLADIFEIERYDEEIISLEGFGEKSFLNLVNSIENSKNTHLSNYLVAMNIPQIGKNAALDISNTFGGDIEKLIKAIDEEFDFSSIMGFGKIMNDEIYKWFKSEENYNEFIEISKLLNFIIDEAKEIDENNPFYNKTIVITGSFADFSRDELSDKMKSFGAKVTGSVSKNTDILLCGEKAGSKLKKATDLGVKVITEQELLELI
ncbi:MAG: NAD-dependent DNA ligase LigA [Clostridia bacterium]|nr:NAD-dependent DNA ligase LigA [Clostridia bacterium]